jgi:hypothetical protein
MAKTRGTTCFVIDVHSNPGPTSDWLSKTSSANKVCYHRKKQEGATERSVSDRAAWHDLASSLPSDRLVFLDECGSHIALTPLAGRPRRGRLLAG